MSGCGFEFVETPFHFIRGGVVVVEVLLLCFLDEIFLFIFLWKILFHFRLFFVLILEVDLINAQSACLFHLGDVLAEYVLWHTRVKRGDVGDGGRVDFTIWS